MRFQEPRLRLVLLLRLRHHSGSGGLRPSGDLNSYQTVTTSTEEATAEISMAQGFFGSLRSGANTIQVVAVDRSGERTKPFVQAVSVIPTPATVDLLALPFEFIPGNDPAYEFRVEVPPEKSLSGVTMPIPWFDKIRLNLAGVAEVKYRLLGGQWEFRGGVKLGSPRLSWGGWKADIEVTPEAKGTASQTRGLDVDEVGLKFRFDAEYPILTVYVLDLVPGGQVVRVLNVLVLVGVDINSVQRLLVNGLFRFDADLLWSYHGARFREATVTPGGGVEALYAPNLLGATMELNLTGRLNFPLRLSPPMAWKVSGEVSLGLRATLWCLLVADMKWHVLSGDIAKSGNWSLAQSISLHGTSPDGEIMTLDGIVLSQSEECPRPMDRGYLRAGLERFVGAGEAVEAGRPGIQQVSALEAFQFLGRASTGGGAALLDRQGRPPRLLGVGQANLPLIENVFPMSEPSLAGSTNELMLVYVSDPGLAGDLQRTDIRWTYWNGTRWTPPESIQTDTRGEFAPQVRFDGRGNALAVWQRVRDPEFNKMDVAAMAAQMEIVWARWGRGTGQWSVPEPLTDNTHLDHAPVLCGPMVGGDVLMTWTENAANQLFGTGAPGDAANSRVLGKRWDSATGRWTATQTIVDRLPYRLSQSLAGATNRAVYAWTRDLDGVVTNANDQQVFYVEWQDGAWGSIRQFTSDTAGNRNVRASVSAAGDVYLVWQKGDDLVMSRNFALPPTVVRTNSASAGFADYALTVGPKGNLVLIWQEGSPEGSDAWFSVYDPASSTWSRDARLFKDEALERSFASVWDDVGNLTLAYNKVQTLRTNVTVNLEGGGSLTFTNVPQPGRVDLGVLKRRLVRDLAIEPGDLTVEAANYMPNAAVTLRAVIRNAGDLAIKDPVIGFYDGDPRAGGTLISNVTVTGWLDGAATHEMTALWVLPEAGSPHTVFAVADPQGKAEDAGFPANNVQSLRLGGTDLAVNLPTQTVETNGALRVVAEVRNVGAPTAGKSLLALRRAGAAGGALASAEVGELEPGRLSQIALDLPPGSVVEGESLYTLTADDAAVILDADRSNNTSTFAVTLFVDSDGDGMPDGWERQSGLDPGVASDAQGDSDGDGASNLDEYQAGTSPRDAASYLRLLGIGAGASGGVEVRWGSSAGRLYTLSRSERVTSGWVPVARQIQPSPPENRFLDATATNGVAFFYRVQVE